VESRKLAHRAEALLEEPPLTLLLSAQAAQLDGDDTAAERYFEAMLDNPELEFLGLRGLLTRALRSGEAQRALGYARRAYRLRPGTDWIQNTLFELQVGGGEWKQAEALLQDMGRRGAVPEAVTRRRRAILLMEQAGKAEIAGELPGAARLATRANAAAPEFVPAAVAAVRMLGRTGKTRRGLKVLEEAWRHAPHPDLVAALAVLYPGDGPARRRERVQRLNALNPGHPEARIALARAALDAGDFDGARNSLEAAGNGAPEARVCALWAELEDAQHGPGLAAREWLLRAARAPAGPAWTCTDCGKSTGGWSAVCPHCEAFDTLHWGPADPTLAAPALEEAAATAAVPPPSAPQPSTGEPEDPADSGDDKLLAPPVPDVPAVASGDGGSGRSP
jgi:HemY protein